MLVQVKREGELRKGAKVSKHISLSGKYIVFMPETDIITVSKKIEEEKERQRLIELVKELLPKNCGAIVRTSSKNKKREEILYDIQNLNNIWQGIKEQKADGFPKIIYKNTDILEKILVDLIEQNIEKIITNEKKIYEEVQNLLKKLNKKTVLELRDDFMESYGLESQIAKLSARRIYLKCGGYISIDKTEALTAIDVNSGKFIGDDNLEETILQVNEEATTQIAKQIRLHDISGIIIVDYINMKKEENKAKIQKQLEQEVKKDRSVVQVVGFTKLNLMEITRKQVLGKSK